MTVNELIDALKQEGITATESEIELLYGDVTGLTSADIPSLVEMWQQAHEVKPAKSTSKRSSKLAKPSRSASIQKADNSALVREVSPEESPTSIQKIDANNLPQVSALSAEQVEDYIAQLEHLKESGQTLTGGLLQFLGELYIRRNHAIELGRNAMQRFQQQDAELAEVMSGLNQTISNSVQGLVDANNLLTKIAAGGAQLGDSFRNETARQKSCFDNFFAQLDAIDAGAGVQDTAA